MHLITRQMSFSRFLVSTDVDFPLFHTGTDTGDILRRASHLVHDRFDFFEMTLQIEEFNETMVACDQCQSPPN